MICGVETNIGLEEYKCTDSIPEKYVGYKFNYLSLENVVYSYT